MRSSAVGDWLGWGRVAAVAIALAWSFDSSGQSAPQKDHAPNQASSTGAPAAVAASLAGELVRRAGGAVPRDAWVVASSLTSDVPSSRGNELAARVASMVAARLGGSARAHASTAPLSVAQAIASKGGALVYVRVEIAQGQLSATADLYPVLSNAWDRARAPLPASRAHAAASAPLDGEARAFLAPVGLDQAHVQKTKIDQGDVLAAACGDVDGDGKADLLLVSRTKITWGHLRAGAFVVARAAPWSALASRAPAPMREPIASSAIVANPRGGGDLFAGLTDRGGVALSRDLLGAAPLQGLPIRSSTGIVCASPNAPLGAFDGLKPCTAGARAPSLGIPVSPFDAVASCEFVGPGGVAQRVVAAREPSGRLEVRLGHASASLEGVGAAVAVGDLDQDGSPEVVTTADSGDDALTISTWNGADLRPRVSLPAPAGVRALAICPPEERGAPSLVAIVGSEVWVVR